METITEEEQKKMQEDLLALFLAINKGEKLTREQKKLLKKREATQYEYYDEPIRKKSACDVYRNNKAFLKNISLLYSNNYEEDSELRKKYGAETKESADEMFEKAHEGLPEKWYNTNKKYYESFRLIFTS